MLSDYEVSELVGEAVQRARAWAQNRPEPMHDPKKPWWRCPCPDCRGDREELVQGVTS